MGDLHVSTRFEWNEASYFQRLCQIIQLLYENGIDYLLTFLTGKGLVQRTLEGHWSSQGAFMARLEQALRRRLQRSTSAPVIRSSEVMRDVFEGNTTQIETLKRKLDNALSQLESYESLCSEVEALRSERYNSENSKHEELLMTFWRLMMPDEELQARIGKQWRHLGFQGDDPATDFRGMGILSLEQLVYLARERPNSMRSIHSLSQHPVIGFPMAIAGITITSLCRHLLADGQLKKFLFNTTDGPITLDDFHDVYCTVFSLFVDFWKHSNPPSVMHFNSVRMNFERALSVQLSRDNINLNNTTVDDLVA